MLTSNSVSEAITCEKKNAMTTWWPVKENPWCECRWHVQT